jgi:hypothetical protein
MIGQISLAIFCFCGIMNAARSEPSPSPSASPTPVPVALDPLLRQAELWSPAQPAGDSSNSMPIDFVNQHRDAGFRWISNARDTAESTRPGLTLFQLPVYEAIARFGQNQLKEITVLFYNRGDTGDLSIKDFNALTSQCTEAISNFTGVQFTDRGRDPSNAVRAEGRIWRTAISQFLLEYSFTRQLTGANRPEFIRLAVTPFEKPKSLLEASLAASHPAAKFSGEAHVKTDPGGDVLITDIPMVDQGQKGYCVVASAERVMRYYGGRVDEHELAEIAGTSAEKGTSVPAMLDSLKKLSGRLHIKIRTVENFDENRIMAIINNYNREARRDQRAVEFDPAVDTFQDVFSRMDSDILRKTRTKNPSEMDLFFRHVQTHVNQGTPLLWSVMIGVLPQPKDPRGYGGHMRLIIGYNAKTKEIMYSDSWGLGHELKRMPLADAWTMTFGLHTIEPL